jgi:two-component system NtrC family sensor kinase
VGNIGIRTGRRGDAGIALEICDDGPGIPAEVASRIFDPFFTTKPVGEGTGLGLSIAYGIVREHEGEISVSDSPQAFPGAGAPGIRWRTSFRVELPAGAPLAVQPAASHPPFAPVEKKRPRNWGRAPRVLVVEDEHIVARLISDVLREEGVTAEVALGGQDGLERLLAAAQSGAENNYDLVICDLKMPGLDGPSLYRELLQRNHPAKNRILFITGDTLSRRTLEFLERYKAPFLPKPFLADELRTAVRQCLGLAAEAPV